MSRGLRAREEATGVVEVVVDAGAEEEDSRRLVPRRGRSGGRRSRSPARIFPSLRAPPDRLGLLGELSG